MFFHFNTTVIFVTKSKIKTAVFSHGGKIIKKEKSFNWSEQNLHTVLDEIASRGPNKARIVFGEEFSYVVALDSIKSDRRHILGKALETIPDDLDGNWDFRNEKNLKSCAQVVAIQSHVMSVFNEALNNAGFRVKAVESQSLALARLLPKKGMFLFAVRDEKFLLGAVLDGSVIATHVSSDKKDFSMMSLFLSTLKKKYGTVPEIIFINKDEDLDPNIVSSGGIKTETLKLDTLYATAMKTHLTGEDSHVLNIKTQKIVSDNKKIEKTANITESEKKEKTTFSMTNREKILAIIFVSAIIGGIFLIKSMGK